MPILERIKNQVFDSEVAQTRGESRIKTRFNRVKNKGPALSDPEPIRSEPHGRRLIEGESKGFTLIELLVTVAIIALLAAIAISTFANVQKSSRDARRKSDLATMQSALEQYHADQGFYPSCIKCPDFGYIDTTLSLTSSTGNPNPPATVKTYSSKLSLDPINTCPDQTSCHKYVYLASPSYPTGCDNSNVFCTGYCLYAKMENSANGGFSGTCIGTTTFDYSVVSP